MEKKRSLQPHFFGKIWWRGRYLPTVPSRKSVRNPSLPDNIPKPGCTVSVLENQKGNISIQNNPPPPIQLSSWFDRLAYSSRSSLLSSFPFSLSLSDPAKSLPSSSFAFLVSHSFPSAHLIRLDSLEKPITDIETCISCSKGSFKKNPFNHELHRCHRNPGLQRQRGRS